MEDATCGVFHTEPEQLFYKSILTEWEAAHLNEQLLSNKSGWKDGAVVIANGIRPYIEVNLTNDLSDVKNRLEIVLRDYFPDVTVSDDARFYNHQCGRVKPHTDGNRDGVSQYTLLLYLCSNFEGGRLSIKLKRSDEEKNNHLNQTCITKFSPSIRYLDTVLCFVRVYYIGLMKLLMEAKTFS